MSANHIYRNGQYLGFVWAETGPNGDLQWFCEDYAGEKRPGRGTCYGDCFEWMVARANERDGKA